MAQPLNFVLSVPETPEDHGQEPSPYDESEVHDSFHQLIEEQSRWVAEEGLELQQREQGAGASETSGIGHQALLGPEDALVHSTATLRILASMPSRTIGRSRGAILSQYYNRTVRLRRRVSRPEVRGMGRSARPSLRLYDLELDPAALEEEEKRFLLVKELQGLTVAQQDHMLRGMPLGLAEKRCLREESRTLTGKRRGRQGRRGLLPCCGQLRDACVLALHSLGLWLLSGLPALMPWRYALKRIGGQFGSSVLSYFLFLKTLLAFNVLLLLPLLAFIVGVQAAFPPASPGSVPTFTGLELLTGGGRFTHTVLYYGYYSNSTLNQPCAPPLEGDQCGREANGLPYNMPLAYLFTVGVAFFITCITLVYSMSRSFGESFRVGSASGVHAITVFCSWDHKVTQRRASRLQHDSIRTHLKELLADWQLRQGSRSACGRLRQVAVLGFVWLLCVGTTLGCTVAVYAFSELMIKSPTSAEQEGALLALPVVVCLLNLGAPYLYRGLAALERHDSPVLEVYVAICRNLILKMAILGILCYHWLGRRVGTLKDQCWENFVGQELYRLMVLDFIFVLLDTLFGELLWSDPRGLLCPRLISEKKLKRREKPEFDIAGNVLELIYGQTLTWLGVLFAPLLPAVQIMKLLLVFYVKKGEALERLRPLPHPGHHVRGRQGVGAPFGEGGPPGVLGALGAPVPGGEYLPRLPGVGPAAGGNLPQHPGGEGPAPGHLSPQGADQQRGGRQNLLDQQASLHLREEGEENPGSREARGRSGRLVGQRQAWQLCVCSQVRPVPTSPCFHSPVGMDADPGLCSPSRLELEGGRVGVGRTQWTVSCLGLYLF
ncbi:transmembrane channel-like protein 6 isoform X2 [Ursus maritimus]|uniref:Transmembrane channel-like protein n=1 Tax=Ursus maritimus TaxID=29073 RepID=A0A8M1GM26_URSMA|nr:transmembrane channel-like protein 6 isoform X2 [Ursus maritimus]XP_040496067.1 transmembrane channel-like protein 6 isoform X2 [Ursus maritimus]XP_040496068.1 transmembrane channel-like protein 6 isoform X2 [Ursus maritimus]XP_040496069.1 transmembrane channel-like protein 6 isoform X2 [Ursus maritimus]XP_040496070.1 transmembrane channel-like protein 6 isoform X2 [Ursus maritimus]XP_040496071.1 transmembrane channel-like protein 6 isoform X2 [Ursus maritimus]